MGMKIALLTILMLAANAFGDPAAGRQADLDFVANQLPTLHPDFFGQLDPAQYRQAVANIQSNIGTLTDAEFYVQLAALVAMAGDPHTYLHLSDLAAATAGFQQFPFHVHSFDDGWFVSGTATNYARALGTQLIAIGGMPIDQVVAQLGTVIPHANPQWVRAMSETYLQGQQILQGLHVAPAGGTTTFTFRTSAGEIFNLDMTTNNTGNWVYMPDSSTGPYPNYTQNTNQNYWFTYEAANRLLYFKYNACQNVASNPFASFANQVLATVDANPIDTFVFDLRGNGGGASNLWDPLVGGLTARFPTLAANPRLRIYGVIDKATFSSGSLDAMLIKQPAPPLPNVDNSHLVQIIGQPTGGATSGWGNVAPFTLPSSGLVGQYSTQYINGPSWVTPGPSFNPDIFIAMRSTDFFARHDPVMAAILAREDVVPAAPTGNAIAVNGASFRSDQGMAPRSLAAVFGSYSQVPDQVLVAGQTAQVVSASLSQVNVVIPAGAAAGTATISVRSMGSELASGAATITAAGPGIFVVGADPSQPGAIENQDGSVNGSSNPAKAGSVVQIFATGAGQPDSSGNAPVSVYFGDIPAQVQASVVLTQYPGLWQINAVVPAGVTGQVPLHVGAQNVASNGVTLYVQ
jgi:uncharacterized protein (TIGR03437 family)